MTDSRGRWTLCTLVKTRARQCMECLIATVANRQGLARKEGFAHVWQTGSPGLAEPVLSKPYPRQLPERRFLHEHIRLLSNASHNN